MAAKKVAKLLLAQVDESRSPLYRWLRQNYKDIKSVIDTQPRPAWQALAKTAAESGQGNPSRQAVRKAWLQLEADMTAAKANHPKRTPVGSVPPAPATPPPDEQKPRYTFKIATFKQSSGDT